MTLCHVPGIITFNDKTFPKSFRHLLDKALAHNLVARSGSAIKPKVLNLMRKNSIVKSCWLSKTMWQDDEYHCCMYKRNYVYVAVQSWQ